MSYLVVGIAIAVMLVLKCFLMKRSITQNSERFINPKSFADELLQSQLKKSSPAKVKQEFSPGKLMAILRKNIDDLKAVVPSQDQKLNLQKLRNVCLCNQLLDNPQISEKNIYIDEIKQLNGSLLQLWDQWLSANKNSTGLPGETCKYLLYLSKHFV